ncbi:uncharacterized protein [Nicotiana tomentosiformis]|uniref:uncharacterized protein n=1 Tax=Nicotiana tomentosiformis TaxID=4098 RepID=UPI00388CA215
MGSLTRLCVAERPIVKEAQQIASQGVRLDEKYDGRLIASMSAKSTLVEQVKAKQFDDPSLLKLKEGVLSGKIKNFALDENGVMRLDGRLCVPIVEDLRRAIMVEAHSSRYSIYPGSTKMYHDLRDVYWWNNMKRDIADYVSRCLNCHYQASIQMALFEALYGRRCRSPVRWFEIGETKLIGPNIVQDALKKVNLIQERLKTVQSRQKSYSNIRRHDLEFKEGDYVFLKVSPMKGIMRFGRKGKLSPRYIRPYPILERIGLVAYRLALPPELSSVHPVFHVSMMRQYFHDPSHVLDRQEVEVDGTLTYEEVPVAIVDRQVRRLRTKDVASVKVI